MIPVTLKRPDGKSDIQFGDKLPFVLIAGPCVIETKAHALKLAKALAEITDDLDIPFIYKSSYDKANRTALSSTRGPGLEEAKAIFDAIREAIKVPILTDVHSPEQCHQIAPHVDILQIPAFLCRQTDLLLAAAATGKMVNIKKGQFLAPWDMKYGVDKVTSAGNENVLVTERGTSFGYNTLVNDFRGLPIMADECKKPVIFDATHSVQQPGGLGGASGGKREFVPPLARAAIAVGVAGLFIEVHEDPDHAPSDGPNMMKLDTLAPLLQQLKAIDALVKGRA